MELAGLLRTTAGILRAAGVPFMLTGSVAAAYHGAVRATMDIDLVVDPNRHTLRDLVERLEKSGAYVSSEAAVEALVQRTMFNVIDPETGWKADLIIRKERPFSEVELSRSIVADFGGTSLPVASLEDVLLSKLEWAKLGGSARQIEDVSNLLKLRSRDVDRAYLAHWARVLEVEAELEKAQALAASLPSSPDWR